MEIKMIAMLTPATSITFQIGKNKEHITIKGE